MVWDRIFGTYQVEEEKIVFGTTSKPYETFDTVTLHFYYYYETVWKKFRQMESLSDKLKALFYGPGWEPGRSHDGEFLFTVNWWMIILHHIQSQNCR